ncbi:MAG TPA: glycosyltransferase family 4 protein [Candidatus Didemnitutus sp.]|nr:glycosyltransferase family 4 protein [Candidatus Didemnitutus sp.]
MADRPLRILLVNRHLNIGGVETYLCRLAAALTARGHRVGLLTEGGRYEAWAVQGGARLFKVASLAHDWPGVLADLRSENFDLVHAHNYNSARAGRRVAAALGQPYLMTVHGPRPRLKQLFFRDWSDEVVAMSEGDRDNISWWGGVGRRPVALSFYGIDTTRFRPGLDPSAQAAEVGVAAELPRIVFVSRFSNRKADVGHALLDALPRLRDAKIECEVLLVGEGPEKSALESHANGLNRVLGATRARLIGPRSDVEYWMTLGDVCVCTANTALEAMACGRPTIAAGRTGYFGPVTPANFESARRICFADHGASPELATPSAFARDIAKLLGDQAAARQAAQADVDVIERQYSLVPMAADMEKIYRRQLALD